MCLFIVTKEKKKFKKKRNIKSRKIDKRKKKKKKLVSKAFHNIIDTKIAATFRRPYFILLGFSWR